MDCKLIFYVISSIILLAISGNADKAAEQLEDWAKEHPNPPFATTLTGRHMPSLVASLGVGYKGPLLLQDSFMIDLMAHFNRERIPERVVHAKGFGAFGVFKVTNDITKFCKAKIFGSVGKFTKVFVRFSTSTPEAGGIDTTRNAYGFAAKFYTEDGIFDLTAVSPQTFFIRDPILFPSLVHANKRNPVTHVPDFTMFWDFMSRRPESTLTLLQILSSLGIPASFRHFDSHAGHTFKLVNKDGYYVWAKFHFKTDQGVKTLTAEEAAKIAAVDPNHNGRDLYNSIAERNYPSWTLYVQIMTPKQAKYYHWNPFDLTKLWWEKDFPLIKVGTLILNRNPLNHFQDVEQVAFSPANLPSGIEPSPDRVLQARMFAYPDTQRYRLGANFELLPTNRPSRTLSPVHSYDKDGAACVYHPGNEGAPNYAPNSFNGPIVDPLANMTKFFVVGEVERWDSADEDNFSQAVIYWKQLPEEEKNAIVKNMVISFFVPVRINEGVMKRVIAVYTNVSADFPKRIAEAIAKFQASLPDGPTPKEATLY